MLRPGVQWEGIPQQAFHSLITRDTRCPPQVAQWTYPRKPPELLGHLQMRPSYGSTSGAAAPPSYADKAKQVGDSPSGKDQRSQSRGRGGSAHSRQWGQRNHVKG
eukprot:6124289-Amphidinium_carterae.2